MDAMKVKIISRQRIKPSSPTPMSLRNFRLSLLDQLSPPEYVPMIFYYTAPPGGTGKNQARLRVDRLRHSLSLTLAKFYPLAGRVRENQFIECNDEGVDFIEAELNVALSEVLQQPSTEVVDQLLPREYHNSTGPLDREVQVAIQANVFTCGGIVIGTCILHKLVDGITFTLLMNSWAADSRGSSSSPLSFSSPLFVGPDLFPQRDLSGLLPTLDIPRDKCVTKRFTFRESKIALLRNKVKDMNPSRVEAVSAFIWRCAMNVTRIRKGLLTRSVLTQTVNLRARMDPPLPENCAGNLLWLAIALAPEIIEPRDQEVQLHELANQIRGSIKKFDREHVRKMQGVAGFSVIIESLKQVVELVSQNVDIYRFTSLGKFQLYEADFGWGKPVWVSSAGLTFKNVIALIEMRDGKGIEAWVTLEEGDMAIFETNRELLSFASANSPASGLLLNSHL